MSSKVDMADRRIKDIHPPARPIRLPPARPTSFELGPPEVIQIHQLSLSLSVSFPNTFPHNIRADAPPHHVSSPPAVSNRRPNLVISFYTPTRRHRRRRRSVESHCPLGLLMPPCRMAESPNWSRGAGSSGWIQNGRVQEGERKRRGGGGLACLLETCASSQPGQGGHQHPACVKFAFIYE